MRRLATKAGREAAQSASIEYAIKAGYILETYKGLKILLRDKDDLIMLKVFKDNAAQEIIFYRYRTVEQRATAINNLKANYDRQTERKEEEKKNKTKSRHAGASSAIKAELIKNFAGVKFSVTSSSFANGDSVHIEWTNGPTEEQVRAYSDKYQMGSFNGMEDIYEYSNSRADISQAKYVQTRRETSEELKNVLEAFKTSLENDENNQWNDNNYLPYKIFNKCSILPDATNFKIVRNEEITSGYAEDFYKITFDAPQQEAKKETAAPNFEAIEVKAGEVQMVDYSPKSIAVIGDTKPLKEQLKQLGGVFNFRLTCGAGWIFQKTKEAEVKRFLNIK